MSINKALLDMDGVLAQFVEGAAKAHNRPDPFDNNPEALGVFDIEKIWKITPEEFWAPINSRGQSFWEDLDKTPEADEIVNIVTCTFGLSNVAILTAPSRDTSCYIGKFKWLDRHFPQFEGRVIFGSAKEFLAAPEHYLFDDRDKNVEAFDRAGGQGILVPRLWNKGHRRADRVIETIKAGL